MTGSEKVRTKVRYACDFCDKEYKFPQDALNCEAAHLGLTHKQYQQYCDLLAEEQRAYGIAGSLSNEYTRQRCDNATKAVLDFQKEYGFVDDR